MKSGNSFRYRIGGMQIETKVPLLYDTCEDGICVYEGSMLDCGFGMYRIGQITVPEEIEGIPVTELRETVHHGIDSLTAPSLKRLFLHFDHTYDDLYCILSFYRSNIETVEITSDREISVRVNAPNVKRISITAPAIFLLDSAFANNEQLEELELHGKLTTSRFDEYDDLAENILLHSNKVRHVSVFQAGCYLTSALLGGGTTALVDMDITVTSLVKGAFTCCKTIRRVHIHDGIQSIGEAAFRDCINLEDAYLPDSLTVLEADTFSGCKSLHSIHMPGNINTISAGVFRGCDHMRSIVLSA